MLILSLELMAKTQDFMSNQLYRPDVLQGVIINKIQVHCSATFFQKVS